MSEPAIRIEGLGKRYRLGRRERYLSLRDSLTRAARRPLRWLRKESESGDNPDSFWALKEISFEVGHGEVVGIIGRNGAGKSTLLKILSRITEPTAGQVDLYGRVGSLLEVGTGFHPELTGRENIYLNGAILGMKREEISRKFDEIVAFSGVEKFLDTAVKHFSSGMYMRLAFAVAAHLEPEILVVDEVLAVGDAEFQKKCLNKMEETGRSGRTVLFVSHNMPSITRLCGRCVLLDEGAVRRDGPAAEVAADYLRSGAGTSAFREWTDPRRMPGDDVARLRRVRVLDDAGENKAVLDIRRPIGIEIEFEVLRPDHVLVPNFHLYNDAGIHVFAAKDLDERYYRRPRAPGRYACTAWVPGNFLSEGGYLVTPAVSTYVPLVVHICEQDAVAFQVVDTQEGGSARGDYAGPFPGVVRPILDWTTRVVDPEEPPR
jgi:lipopolysaccharide transport system ATP-binding protein